MKKLILIALFVPYFSFAQRIEISEQAGYSTTTGLNNNWPVMNGFSNQVSVGYRCLRHFSVSAYYQFNSWNDHNNVYGISPDFVTKHFYAGLDLQMVTLAFVPIPLAFPVESYHFNTSWGYGIHIGAKQKIIKRLYAVMQIGYDIDNVSYTTASNTGGPPIDSHEKNTETLNIWYLRAGLSYRL